MSSCETSPSSAATVIDFYRKMDKLQRSPDEDEELHEKPVKGSKSDIW